MVPRSCLRSMRVAGTRASFASLPNTIFHDSEAATRSATHEAKDSMLVSRRAPSGSTRVSYSTSCRHKLCYFPSSHRNTTTSSQLTSSGAIPLSLRLLQTTFLYAMTSKQPPMVPTSFSFRPLPRCHRGCPSS
jgi:hypothetical protein